MKLRIARETLAGTKQEFEFQHEGEEYIVKNFSDGNMYVSFEETATDDESIKISADKAQICTCGAEVKKIYVKGTGEVEVQQL